MNVPEAERQDDVAVTSLATEESVGKRGGVVVGYVEVKTHF